MPRSPRIELTEQQSQVLTGLMLGDGHLIKPKVSSNAALLVGRSQVDTEYLKYEATVFFNLLSPLFQKKLVSLSSVVDSRTDNTYHKACFYTIYNQVFTDYHSKWYHKVGNKNVKIVPTDLQLTPITIAHWIADDAHIGQPLPYRFTLEIATHGFTEIEVNFLAGLLHNRYGEKFDVGARIRKGKTQWIIRASDSACRALFADIDPYFKMNRKRHWDNPEARFWSNQPERQVCRNDLFVWRLKKLQEIIDNNDQMSAKEVVKLLQYNEKKGGSLHKLQTILRQFQDQITVDRSNYNYVLHFNH